MFFFAIVSTQLGIQIPGIPERWTSTSHIFRDEFPRSKNELVDTNVVEVNGPHISPVYLISFLITNGNGRTPGPDTGHTFPPKSEGKEPHWSVDRVSWPPGTSFPLQERMSPAILQLFISNYRVFRIFFS